MMNAWVSGGNSLYQLNLRSLVVNKSREIDFSRGKLGQEVCVCVCVCLKIQSMERQCPCFVLGKFLLWLQDGCHKFKCHKKI